MIFFKRVKNKKPFFSIVIPTLNEEVYLPKLLADIKEQTYQNFEVIVVDSKSTDKTLNNAKKFKKFFDLRLKQANKKNVAYQRNLGAKCCRGEYVIFMDADDHLPSYFLQGIKYKLDKFQPDVFSTSLLVKLYPPEDRALAHLINSACFIASKVYPQAPGAMIGVRKEILKRHKFNEEMHSSEDRELVIRLVQEGFKFTFFKSPGYAFSFRRFKKEGDLKLLYIYAMKAIKYATGTRFKNPLDYYPMLGGSYYRSNEEDQHNIN